jgi:hypothetical protein
MKARSFILDPEIGGSNPPQGSESEKQNGAERKGKRKNEAE